MMRLTMLLALFLALPAVCRAADEVVVTKTALDRNPRLRLLAFQGRDGAQLAVNNVLHYADWFTLVGEGQTDYRLGGDCPNDREMTLALQDADGKEVLRFTVRQDAADMDALARLAVDTLIERVFANPGPCRAELAFVYRAAGVGEIWTSAFDGSAPRQQTHNGRLSTEPDWGPGNRYLVYTLYNRLSTSVVLVDRRRGQQRRLSSFPGLNSGAAIAPDRQRIALTLSREDNVDIYTMAVNAGTLDRLTRTPGVEASPCWSPDGRRICYVSDSASHRPTLYVMSAAGGAAKRLLSVPQEAVSPDWSAASDKLCFAVRRGANYTLAVLDMAAGDRDPRVVVSAAGDWEAPSWLPDGRHVVCTRRHDGTQRLYIVDTWFGRLIPLRFTGDVSLPACSGTPSD